MNNLWKTFKQELDNRQTTHRRRLQIGQALAEAGDPRQGVGIQNGVPEIKWLPIEDAGRVEIQRLWIAEHPDEEDRVVNRQTFYVEPFYIAKYLVSHAQYQLFVDADDGFENSTWWQEMSTVYQRQPLSQQRTRLLNNPRDSISWYQSVAFARWLNHQLHGLTLPHPSGKGSFVVGKNAQIRLPMESEWQWAAQNGAEARSYPWGDELHTEFTNTANSGLNQAIAVGMYPHGAAACGAMDMAGNLMEWCATDKANPEIFDVASTASKVLRGGDWGYHHATSTYCDDDEPSRIDPLNGCRLAICAL